MDHDRVIPHGLQHEIGPGAADVADEAQILPVLDDAHLPAHGALLDHLVEDIDLVQTVLRLGLPVDGIHDGDRALFLDLGIDLQIGQDAPDRRVLGFGRFCRRRGSLRSIVLLTCFALLICRSLRAVPFGVSRSGVFFLCGIAGFLCGCCFFLLRFVSGFLFLVLFRCGLFRLDFGGICGHRFVVTAARERKTNGGGQGCCNGQSCFHEVFLPSGTDGFGS